jgi:hypothetical protein
MKATERAYKLGFDVAMHRKYCTPVTNPYARKQLHAEWRRGFLAGGDERERQERATGQAISPAGSRL